jgi:hypothetical protein
MYAGPWLLARACAQPDLFRVVRRKPASAVCWLLPLPAYYLTHERRRAPTAEAVLPVALSHVRAAVAGSGNEEVVAPSIDWAATRSRISRRFSEVRARARVCVCAPP